MSTTRSSDEEKQKALEILVKVADMNEAELEQFARPGLQVEELIGIFRGLGVEGVSGATIVALQEVVEDYCDRLVAGYNDWTDVHARQQWNTFSRRLLSVASETFD